MVLTPPPPLGRLRLAKLSDVPRIAVVAAAGFWHSPVFHYERPHFGRYPYDTLASYRKEYQQAILDPKTAVLVIEDEYRKDEVRHAYDALSIVYPTLHEQLPPEEWESSTLIVGVGSLRLQPQSARYGTFQPEDGDVPHKYPRDCRRDKVVGAGEILDRYLSGPEDRWFSGCLEITTMVVHPAYWHRGHASSLTKWCMALAEVDHAGVGVSATPMGRKLFQHLGFKEKQVVDVEGYDGHPEGISLWIGVRDAERADAKEFAV